MPSPQTPITPRLRLRRAFLRAAIASLAVGGVVAVAALLFNRFNDQTGRILITLVALAFHCWIAMVLLGRLDMGRSGFFARTALAAFTVEFAVLLISIWGNRWWHGEGFFTLLMLCGAVILARPGAWIVESRKGPPALGWATVIAAAVALILSLIAMWGRLRVEEVAQAAGTAAVIAFTLGQFSALIAARAGPDGTAAVKALSMTCLISATLVALGISLMIWDTDYFHGDLAIRVLMALGVVDVCSTLVLMVMARLRGTPTEVGAISTVREIWLRCPRCAQEQEIAIGGGACGACALKIDVRVEATHCATCGYALANLPSRICPECGTGF